MEGIGIVVVEWVGDPELAQRHAEIKQAYSETIDATREKSQRDRATIEALEGKLEEVTTKYRQLMDGFATQFEFANKAFKQFMEVHALDDGEDACDECEDECNGECQDEITHFEEMIERSQREGFAC